MNLIYMNRKQYAEQEKVLEEAIKKYPISLDFLYNLVNVHIATNNMPKLLNAIDRILELDPNNLQVLPIKARILERQGKNLEALDIYKRLYALSPDNFELLTGLARANFNVATEIVNNGATIASDTEYALVRQKAAGYFGISDGSICGPVLFYMDGAAGRAADRGIRYYEAAANRQRRAFQHCGE